jgi:hypothetical protein
MADTGIKKVIVGKQDFPPLAKLAEDVYGYLLRYRVISEDRNRFSHWSETVSIPAFSADSLPEQVDGSLTISDSSIVIVWDDEVDRPRYDIFVRFDAGDFFYHGTSPIHTYSIIPVAGFSSIEVAIQIEGVNKERSDILTICELSDTIES